VVEAVKAVVDSVRSEMFIGERIFQKRAPAPEERNKHLNTDFMDYTDSERMRHQSRCQLEDRSHLAPTEL
jgi:hypothetical protein